MDGLRALGAVVRVPRILDHGRDFVLLEQLDLKRNGDWAALAQMLAILHRQTGPRFGWQRDNWIGGSPQPNGWLESWPEFFAVRRLGAQRELARRHGLPAALLDALAAVIEGVPRLLAGHRPAPSLLHGDLWSGNWLAAEEGPVLIDPAVYFGDRECDLAMTRLFGGFGAAFYSAYEAAWPLPAGATRRVELYNLYHVVNHANLFGGGYLAQAEALARRCLAQ